MDDRKIVELFRKRDEAAIELTAKKYGARLFGLALSVLNDRQTAEECVNDVYMKVWESIPPNDPAGYFPTYLLRVTLFGSLRGSYHSLIHRRPKGRRWMRDRKAAVCF